MTRAPRPGETIITTQATADESGRVLLWEVSTGKLTRETAVPGPLSALRWNPHVEHHVLAVAGREGVYLVDTKTARGDDREATKGSRGRATAPTAPIVT